MNLFKKSSFAVIALLSSLAFLSSCKKEAVQSSSLNQNSVSDQSDDAEIPGSTKLVLHPGPKTGHDAYVYYYAGDLNSIYANANAIPELSCERWTQNDYDEAKKIYIKFSDLSQIPTTATITKATLQFYGLDGYSLSHPQGNSIYPGSPYNIYPDNSCLVQRVIDKWDEKTINWSNQPAVTDVNESVIPVSTDQWNYNPKIDVTKMVQKMVAHPRQNNGFKVSLNVDVLYRSQVYGSCESSDPSRRPRLVVWYE